MVGFPYVKDCFLFVFVLGFRGYCIAGKGTGEKCPALLRFFVVLLFCFVTKIVYCAFLDYFPIPLVDFPILEPFIIRLYFLILAIAISFPPLHNR